MQTCPLFSHPWVHKYDPHPKTTSMPQLALKPSPVLLLKVSILQVGTNSAIQLPGTHSFKTQKERPHSSLPSHSTLAMSSTIIFLCKHQQHLKRTTPVLKMLFQRPPPVPRGNVFASSPEFASPTRQASKLLAGYQITTPWVGSASHEQELQQAPFALIPTRW